MVTEYLIGTGGWAYLNVAGKSSLKTYSELLNSVEVNYTFYEYPDAKTVERWRRTVPRDFTLARAKKNGAENATLKNYSSMPTKLPGNTDLTPESVKEYLTKTNEWRDSSKSLRVAICTTFLKFAGWMELFRKRK